MRDVAKSNSDDKSSKNVPATRNSRLTHAAASVSEPGMRNQVALVGLVAVLTGACVASPDADVETSSQSATANVTVAFKSDWTTDVRGTLMRGKRMLIEYATERATCTGTFNGALAWSVTAFYRWDGGEVATTYAAGFTSDPSAPPAGIDLDRSGQLEVWFQNTNRWGCNAYDSNYGQNYKFNVEVAIAGNEPNWLGNANYAIERATCNGGVCPGAWRSLDNGFTYDTWARQRAALRVAGFEVWKPGVTDLDNPNLWQQLDAQIHYRYVGQSAFVTDYINFDQRWSNNAHYAVDLRAFDPFAWPNSSANIRTVADCPAYTLRRDTSNQYVEAELEFYFSVNGKELRVASGNFFRGRYQDYLGNYAICVQ